MIQKQITENLNSCLNTPDLKKFCAFNDQKLKGLREDASKSRDGLAGLREQKSVLIAELEACMEYTNSRM